MTDLFDLFAVCLEIEHFIIQSFSLYLQEMQLLRIHQLHSLLDEFDLISHCLVLIGLQQPIQDRMLTGFHSPITYLMKLSRFCKLCNRINVPTSCLLLSSTRVTVCSLFSPFNFSFCILSNTFSKSLKSIVSLPFGCCISL